MPDDELSRRACVLLFSKPARAGRVKTRLIGELSAEQAAELHAAFLGDALAALRRGRFDYRLAWAVDPDELDERLKPPRGVPAFLQEGESLGDRLFNGLRRLTDRFELVAAVGSDSPELQPETIEDAFGRLAAGAEVVLGPTRDGGYYLIALRRSALRRELFDGVAWSTESVLDDTLQRCRDLGLEVEMLPVVDDIDIADDLRQLARRLSRTGDEPAGPRQTRDLLTSWGWISAAGPSPEGESCES